MKKQTSSITVKASLENLERINSFIRLWTKKVGLSPGSENQLLLAVEEACVNVAKYAYPEFTGPVTIDCRLDGGSLILQIRDEGVPFNPLKTPEPDLALSLEEREVGGLGIFFIRRLVDEVKYQREGKFNVLTLSKSEAKRTLSQKDGEGEE